MLRLSLTGLVLSLVAGCMAGNGPQPKPARLAASAEAVPFVTISPQAQAQVAKIARQQNHSTSWRLRLGFQPGGCSGFITKLDLDPEGLGPGDVECRCGEVTLVYHRSQQAVAQGAHIDYDVQGKGFTVTFPNKTPENKDKTTAWYTAELRKMDRER